MSWNDLFVNMDNTNFFNFSFLPKYGSAFVRGFEYTLLLAVVKSSSSQVSGLVRLPPSSTSKCRCAPKTLPVAPL